MKEIKGKSTNILHVLGIVYGLGLFYLLFLYRAGSDYAWTYSEYLLAMSNFIPLKSVYVLLTTPVISASLILRFVINFVGNILLFIPWGILLPLCFNRLQSFKKFVVITCTAVLLIETIQLFAMLGSFDIEDILLNVSGACIGFGVHRALFRKKDKTSL